MVELRLLGLLDLRRDNAEPLAAVLAQPKRVAVLAYLALARDQGFCRRDVIAALLWPDQDQEHSRGSLRQAVRFLRRELGDAVIRNRGEEEIGLDETLIQCDVVALRRALDAGNPEEAAHLYRGDLLEGFFITEAAPEFDQWLDGERAGLRTLATRAFWALTEHHRERGAFTDAIVTARDAVRLAPDDESGMRRFLDLLDAAGDRAGAVAAYEQLAERLRAEYDAEPSAETQRSIAAIRARSEPHEKWTTSAVTSPVVARESTPAAPARGRAQSVSAVALGAAVVVVVAGYFVLAAFRAGRAPDRRMSVAVVPVRNLTPDTASAVLAEALTDELITDLAQISALSVINRRTMIYLDTMRSRDSLLEAAGVQAVITSTLERSGDSVRLRMQLVPVGETRVALGRSFSGTPGRAFAWQHDVALAVAEWARVELRPHETAALATRHDIDPQAFESYARARWAWNKRGRLGLSRADKLFHQALDVQPTYALAWSGLADTYVQLGYGGYLPPDEAFPKAKAMARRALDLDSTLAEPHAALGYALMYYDWDWAAAEREFVLAVSRRPSYAVAHEWYGLFLTAMGRFADAQREGRIAQDLDPLSAAVTGTRGWILHYSGRDDEALRVLRIGEHTDSTVNTLQLYLGRVHQSIGQLDSASAHYAATGGLRSWIPNMAGEGVVAAERGRAEEARQVIRRLDSLTKAGEYVTPYAVALIYTALGDKDSAFGRLEQGFKERTHWLVWLNRDSRWKSLHGDPRFGSLVKRIGLPN